MNSLSTHLQRLQSVPSHRRLLVIAEGHRHGALPPFYKLQFECLLVDKDPRTEPDVCADALDLPSLPPHLRFGHACFMSPPLRMFVSEKFLPMLARTCDPKAWIWDPYLLSPVYKSIAYRTILKDFVDIFWCTSYRVIMQPNVLTYMRGNIPQSRVHARFWISEKPFESKDREIFVLIWSARRLMQETLVWRHRNDKRLLSKGGYIWRKSPCLCPWDAVLATKEKTSVWRWFEHGYFYEMDYVCRPFGFACKGIVK